MLYGNAIIVINKNTCEDYLIKGTIMRRQTLKTGIFYQSLSPLYPQSLGQCLAHIRLGKYLLNEE